MKDENKWKAVDSWVRRMILDSLQSKSFVFLHKCLCQNASLFCWKSVSILKTKRNASYYLAGQLLQPSIYRRLEQLTSVRCTNDASSDHLSLTSQNWEKANELKDGDWMWWQGKQRCHSARERSWEDLWAVLEMEDNWWVADKSPTLDIRLSSYRSLLHKLSLWDEQSHEQIVFLSVKKLPFLHWVIKALVF